VAVDVDHAVLERVVPHHAVVELPERATGVGDHVGGEPVDGLELGQELRVVEVAQSDVGLGHQLLNTGQLERAPDQWLRRATDQPVLVIFAVTLVVVVVAVVSLFLLINQKNRGNSVELGFALLSIPLGWFTIHAMAALHYAHVYWMDGDAVDAETKKKIPVGGLLFPGDKRPEGWDFLYFSAVIGMTAQTADTNISTTHMRCVVLVHSILSFFFNTVIVAAAVNLAVSLGGP